MRFSELERAIPAISQKMLIQQLRQMESDGIVRRIVHHQVPPKVEYGLTDWGQALCPALDAISEVGGIARRRRGRHACGCVTKPCPSVIGRSGNGAQPCTPLACLAAECGIGG